MKPHITVTKLLLPLIMATAAYSSDENVEGIINYTDKTVNVYTAQDLAEAASDKHNFTVYLHNSIHVTEEVPHYDGLLNNAPCWDNSALFNLSNYVFQAGGSAEINLSFCPTTADAKVGKVVRNGRAEFHKLRKLSFSNITNTESDTDGTFTPVHPYSLAEVELGAATDILDCHGYGGVFRSASGLTKDEDGGVGIYDCYGEISFSNITYDGSSMGDVNCGIHLSGGAIYADDEWNTEIKNNGGDTSGGVRFTNVYITLDRSAKYANSSSCYFYAYGGAIHTRDLCIDGNYGTVSFENVGIQQVAVHHDEGYGSGGALYLKGTANSLSGNSEDVNFNTCTINVANTAKGGAVFLADNTTLNICDNGGDVHFYGCEAVASAIDGTLNDDATAQGGAIYLGNNSTLNIQNNKYVQLSCNTATATATQADSTALAQGGAIYGSSGSHIRICNNGTVFFAENKASVGSAIYTQGDVTICNNSKVFFSENAGDYAVYMTERAATLTLSGDFSFQDALYTAGNADFNASYNGEEQKGNIEFYKTTAVVEGTATLHNGTLSLLRGSTFSSKLTLAPAATLAAEGQGNSITHFELGENSTLSLTLSSPDTTEAVLRTSSFSTNGSFTLNIYFQGRPENGEEYILLELTDLPYSDTAWNEDNVHVTGNISFSDLVWTNDYTRLVYRAIPEPGATTLALLALSALASRRRRRK